MTESSTISKEEIAREIKEIFTRIKNNPNDIEYYTQACAGLRSRSERGYRGLLRLLHKYGFLNVLNEISLESSLESSCSKKAAKRGLDEDAKQSKMASRSKSARTYSTSSAPPECPSTSSSTVTLNKTDTESVQNGSKNRRRTSTLSDKELHRSERYERTKNFLSKSGLLGITNKTAELLKQNKKIQHELDSLKQQADAFVQSVLSNPANKPLMQPIPSASLGTIPTSSTTVTHSRSSATPQMTNTLNMVDSNDLNSILSGIYDFEVPSVILAPAAAVTGPNMEQMAAAALSDSSPPLPAAKRPKVSISD